jgi:hypothetical protein
MSQYQVKSRNICFVKLKFGILRLLLSLDGLVMLHPRRRWPICRPTSGRTMPTRNCRRRCRPQPRYPHCRRFCCCHCHCGHPQPRREESKMRIENIAPQEQCPMEGRVPVAATTVGVAFVKGRGGAASACSCCAARWSGSMRNYGS